MLRGSRALSSQIFAFQVAILLVTGLIGAGLALHGVQARLDRDYEQRALAVARSVAADPDIQRAVAARDSGMVQRAAEAVRRATHTSFVVVTDRDGIRFSHPTPSEIGRRVSTDPSEALAGKTVLAVETGTLGRSARAKVPLRNDAGRIIGVVSVGILESTIRHDLTRAIPIVLLYVGIALGIGLLASFALARRLKRQTFGLELGEIASLLQEREAMLHGIREGVLAVDPQGRVRLINDEARRLLDLPDDDLVGGAVPELGDEGRLAELAAGRIPGRDLLVVRGDRVLLANRMPIDLHGRDLGAVVTLRDRTELEAAVRELDDVRSLSDALRAQAHEFFNRMHTVSGLLELGHYDEAVGFVNEITAADSELRADLAERIADPLLAALLLAKSAVAAERGIDLRLTGDTQQVGTLLDAQAVVTVVGNLLDNAMEAAAADPAGRREVDVTLRTEGRALVVQVADSGPGVPAGARDAVFEDGYTTKPAEGTRARGVGLALVRRIAERRGGVVAVGDAPDAGGALFEVRLPGVVAADEAVRA